MAAADARDDTAYLQDHGSGRKQRHTQWRARWGESDPELDYVLDRVVGQFEAGCRILFGSLSQETKVEFVQKVAQTTLTQGAAGSLNVFFELVKESLPEANLQEDQIARNLEQLFSAQSTAMPKPTHASRPRRELLTSEQVKNKLDIGDQKLKQLSDENAIVRFKTRQDKRAYVYPDWQFEDSTVLNGLPDVLATLSAEGLEAERLLTTPLELTAGRSLIDLLRSGKLNEATQIAEQIQCDNK